MKERLLLLSFGKVEGFKNISANLEHTNGNAAPEPENSEFGFDTCLISWNYDGQINNWSNYPKNLTKQTFDHEAVFSGMKKEWTLRRDHDTFTIFKDDLDVQGMKGSTDSYWSGCFLPNKRHILATSSALDGHRTIELQRFPRREISEKYQDSGKTEQTYKSNHR